MLQLLATVSAMAEVTPTYPADTAAAAAAPAAAIGVAADGVADADADVAADFDVLLHI